MCEGEWAARALAVSAPMPAEPGVWVLVRWAWSGVGCVRGEVTSCDEDDFSLERGEVFGRVEIDFSLDRGSHLAQRGWCRGEVGGLDLKWQISTAICSNRRIKAI